MRPRVVVLTNLTTRNSLPAIDALWRAQDLDLCHVLFYDTLASSKRQLSSVIRQFGVRKTAAKAAGLLSRKVRLVLMRHSPWRPTGGLQFSHEFAVVHRVPFTTTPDINDPASVQFLNDLAADVLITCNLSQILASRAYLASRLGAINVHLSLLPRYRGPLPVFWALYNDESETGVTFHRIADGIDDGDILSQYPVRIEESEDEKALTSRLFAEAGRHVADVVRDFVAGAIQPRPQDHAQAAYQSFPTAEHRRTLAQRQRQLRQPQ